MQNKYQQYKPSQQQFAGSPISIPKSLTQISKFTSVERLNSNNSGQNITRTSLHQNTTNETGMHRTDSELRNEIRQLKVAVLNLEQKVNQSQEQITQIQLDFNQQFLKLRETLCEQIDKIKQQQGIFERRIADEQKNKKQEINAVNNKIYESRIEMESKFITLDEQMKMVMQTVENRMKQNFDSQFDTKFIKQTLENMQQELEFIHQRKISRDSPQLSNLVKKDDLTYSVDVNGYLIDDKGNYIIDEDGNIVRLNEEQLERLKMQFQI